MATFATQSDSKVLTSEGAEGSCRVTEKRFQSGMMGEGAGGLGKELRGGGGGREGGNGKGEGKGGDGGDGGGDGEGVAAPAQRHGNAVKSG